MKRVRFGLRCPAALVLVLTTAAHADPPTRTDYYGDPLPPGVLARMGSVQLRHYNARIAFAADGKTLLSASGTVRFWDMASGRQLRQTRLRLSKDYSQNANGWILELAPDGKLAAVWFGGEVHLCDTVTGAEVRRLEIPGMYQRELAFSADGKRIVALIGNRDEHALRVWETATGKVRLALERLKPALSLRLSADGKVLGYYTDDQIHLWDIATRRERASGRVGICGWALAPDGQTFATVDHRQSVTLWAVDGLKKMATFQPAPQLGLPSAPIPLTFSPDGKLLALGGQDAIVLWDVAAGKERLRLPVQSTKQLRFSPDCKILACAGEFDIRLWDATTGKPLLPRPGHDSNVRSVAFSPNGRFVASTARYDPCVRLWDASTGNLLESMRTDEKYIHSIEFTKGGELLVSGDSGAVHWLQPGNGKELRRFLVTNPKSGRRSQGTFVSHLSPDGKRLAAVSSQWEQETGKTHSQVTVWNSLTGELVKSRPFGGGSDSRFTPDGEGVSVDGRDRLSIEDTVTGEERAAIPGDLGAPVAFSGDGQLVAVGIHETLDGLPPGVTGYRPLGLRLAEVAMGQEIFHLDGRIELASISPDGRVLVTADADALCVWDMRTGERLLRRPWPVGFVRRPRWTAIDSLAFRPDSRAVVTGMNDGTILVWDLTPEKAPKPLGDKLGRKELDALWSDLAGDARTAHRAVFALTAAPASTLPYLAERLRPVVAVDARRVEKLLANLDSEQFAVRDAAARELTEMGEQVEPALRRVLKGKPSLEVSKRVRSILEALRTAPPAATLRTLRAIRVLEGAGTPEARRILRTLAGGADAARPTREAKKALERTKQ